MRTLGEHIVRAGGGYRLVSHKGKNLGTYKSKAGAAKRERQVEYFKHHSESIEEHFAALRRLTFTAAIARRKKAAMEKRRDVKKVDDLHVKHRKEIDTKHYLPDHPHPAHAHESFDAEGAKHKLSQYLHKVRRRAKVLHKSGWSIGAAVHIADAKYRAGGKSLRRLRGKLQDDK